MERDFMGLALKQEAPDEVIDAAPLRSSAMQWSFSNKASPLPQLLSFQSAQGEKPKTGFESLVSTGLVTITTAATSNSDNKSYSGVMQKNIAPEKQSQVHNTVTTYPTNLISTVSAQPLSAVPMAIPMPSSSPVVGTTDLRNGPKISGAPSQLTIFYNGSVCVFNNISEEKAQAIMLLAGNGPPVTSSTTVPVSPVQASMPRSSVLDGFIVSQPYGTTPYCSSPATITISDATASRLGDVLVSSNKIEPLKVVNSLGSVSPNFLPLGTVPQFRKKSLARFLEKRKQRVINASPYANKQSPDCSTPGAGSTSLSMNSSGSSAVPAVNIIKQEAKLQIQ